MSLIFAITPALPLGKAGKFVAGAYIFVFVVILVYVAIMAIRSQRTQHELEELRRDVDAVRAERERDAAAHDDAAHDAAAHDDDDAVDDGRGERSEQTV